MMQPLYGHTSPESAFVVADYPYGFRLRTQIRYWIETKEGFGQRMVSQTLNPKTGRWNKPKAGTYSAVLALCLNDEGHVQSWGLTSYRTEDEIASFLTVFPALANDPYTYKAVRYLRAAIRAQKHYTITIGVGDGPRQSREEQATIVRKAIRYELLEENRQAVRDFR